MIGRSTRTSQPVEDAPAAAASAAGKSTQVERSYGAAAGGALGGAAPAAGRRAVPFEEALVVMDVITQLLEADGMPIFSTDDAGLGHTTRLPPRAAEVPARWQALVQEWWMVIVGKVKHPSGMVVSDEGDIRTTHLDGAVAETAPFVAALLAEGDATTPSWVASNYEARVQKLRVRAAGEAVAESVARTAKHGAGGELDLGTMTEIEQLHAVSTSAIKTLRAAMTVSTRFASANANQLKELDKAYAAAIGSTEIPKSLATTRAANLNTALGLAQGNVYMVQSILTISDPKKRYEQYQAQWARFGAVAGSTEFLKDLGVLLGGATAVAGAATFAIAKLAGKTDLAAKALSFGSKASTELGKINIALNALGVIHGIAVLCDRDATAMEKTEAGVEAASGALGLAGRFIPAISPVTAALSGSLLINFYAFKGILEAGLEGYAGLIALGFNICYEDMKQTGGYISQQAMSYAAALDLAGTFDDPLKIAELVKQTEAQRSNLVEIFLRPFLARATRSAGGGNKDPGVYSVLRRRFAALGKPALDTPEHVIAFTHQLLEVIVRCFADAQEIYQAQVRESWADR